MVHASACPFCADAQTALAELGREFPIEVDLAAADSEAGRALVSVHRPALFPLVLVDGSFFSAGRLPRRKLRARLTTSAAVTRP
jgi:glutaredoxin